MSTELSLSAAVSFSWVTKKALLPSALAPAKPASIAPLPQAGAAGGFALGDERRRPLVSRFAHVDVGAVVGVGCDQRLFGREEDLGAVRGRLPKVRVEGVVAAGRPESRPRGSRRFRRPVRRRSARRRRAWRRCRRAQLLGRFRRRRLRRRPRSLCMRRARRRRRGAASSEAASANESQGRDARAAERGWCRRWPASLIYRPEWGFA